MAYRSLEEPNRKGEFLLSWSIFGSGEDNNFKQSLRLKFVKIPGLSAWLIFDLSLFEQQLLLSLIPSIPVVSSGTMLTPGAMSWWVLITMGTLSFCRDENKVYPKKSQGLSWSKFEFSSGIQRWHEGDMKNMQIQSFTEISRIPSLKAGSLIFK